jgi:hypothetical protein
MARFLVRAMALSFVLATLASVTVAAAEKEYGKGKGTDIEEGTDYWRTPPGGTAFTFPPGDVEALCHKSADPSWGHKVDLQGVPAKGSDWDSAVSRLKDAKFDKTGTAHTTVRFKSLSLVSSAPTDTPCGKLDWTAHLAKGNQPITKMKITTTPDNKGGTFFADLALRVEFRATKVGSKATVGRLFYDVKLPDQSGGTPWSFGAKNVFRAGMGSDNSCLQVLRDKLGTFPAGSQHIYYISNLIAKGQCKERPN